MSPAAEHLVLQVLQGVLPSLEKHRKVLLADRGIALVGHRRQEDPVHVITQVCDRLWDRHRRYLLDQRLTEVSLPVRLIQQERVRLEVVDRLVYLVDGLNFNDTTAIQVLEIHVCLVQLLLDLVKAARQVALLGRIGHFFLHLLEVARRPTATILTTSAYHRSGVCLGLLA